MKKSDFITFEEFVNISGVKESTIKKRYKDIPGITKEGKTYTVLSGTRYPCDLHRYKLRDSNEKRYVLLKMISQYKYISHKELRLEYAQFNQLLKDLISCGFIRENNLCNKYGANAYDCTELGDKILNQKEVDSKREMLKLLAEMAGTFTGTIISKVYDKS